MTTRREPVDKSFYIPVTIVYKKPTDFSAQYQYYALCPVHNKRLLEDRKLDTFVRFNHICYTCPSCPLYLSVHEHAEHTGCTKSRCEPLRFVYKPSEKIEHLNPHHRCSDHFYTNRLRIELGFILTPEHDYSPFFSTERSSRDAGDSLFQAAYKAAQDPEIRLPSLYRY
jgi:hypothetical protein